MSNLTIGEWPTANSGMASEIRRLDWAAGPLGAVDHWPGPLRTVVDLILASPLPMLLLWGDQRIQFFNDAFARLDDGDGANCLGRPVAAAPPPYLDPAIFDAGAEGDHGPRTLTWANPMGEEHRFDVTASPVRGDGDAIAGVLVILAPAAQSFRQQSQHLRAIIDRLPIGIGTVDASTGEVTSLNAAGMAMHGMADARMPLRQLADYRQIAEYTDARGRPLDIPDWPVSRAVQGESMRDFTVIAHPPGEPERVLAYSADPPTAESPEVVVVIRDVTERHRAGRELRRAYGLLDGITQGTHDLIAALDRDFRFTFFNVAYRDEFKSLWGQEIEVGTSLLDALAPWPEEQARAREMWQRALFGDSFHITAAFGPNETESQYYDLEFNPVVDAERGQIGAAHILRNVTERVRMQQVLQEREASLRDSELFYRQAIESMPGMTFSCDPDGYCHYLSEQWAEYTGIPTEQLLGNEWPRFVHPDERQMVFESFSKAVATVTDYDIEYRIVRFDGVAEWFKVRGHAMFNAEGTVARWIGTAVNVENLKRAEATLQQADRRKDEFLATLAHELRNPLGPMRSAMEILRLGGADPDNLDRVLPIMERQMQQLSRMVDDLIDASRVSRGKVVLQQADEDLTEILRDAVDAARITANFGNRQIELVLNDRTTLPIRADRVRLTQVFGNLLTNAAKFTDDDGRIVIAARRFGGQVRVAVRDDGIGIERHLLDRVFELFTQANPGETSGLGIGLALVRSLVKSHGGDVEVHSDGPGRGSEFVVSLPLAEGAKPLPIR